MIKHLYFPHDGNAINDEKLLMLRSKYKAEGYGIFWMILESMFMASNGRINRVAIGGLSLCYGVAIERLTEIINYCISIGLFKESQAGAISSPRMDSHLATLESLRVAGRRGAEKRWKTSEKNSHPNGTPIALNKTKGNKIRISSNNSKLEEVKEIVRVDGSNEPTPAQQVRNFFNNETDREQWIVKLVEKGIDGNVARSEIKKFCSYWTEKNKTGTKQRWELEKVFELRRRLATWISRSNSFPKH